MNIEIEDIFNKPDIKTAKLTLPDEKPVKEKKKRGRPKKKLSEAQLQALAKGRARMKEKRDEASARKKQKEENEALFKEQERKRELRRVENDDKAIVDNQKNRRTQKLKMNELLDQQREIALHNKFLKEHNAKLEKFKKIKYKYMEQAKSLKEYTEFKSIMDDIPEEVVLDNGKLVKHLEAEMVKYTIKKSNDNINDDHKQNDTKKHDTTDDGESGERCEEGSETVGDTESEKENGEGC